MLSLKNVAKLLTSSCDARNIASSDARGGGGEGANMAGTLREWLSENGHNTPIDFSQTGVASPPRVPVAQRWRRATHLQTSVNSEELERVRKWSSISGEEELGAEIMRDLTTSRNFVVGGRPIFINPNANLKRIHARDSLGSGGSLHRRLPSDTLSSAPDAFKPKVLRGGKILHLPTAAPSDRRASGRKPRRSSVSSHGSRPGSASSQISVDASGYPGYDCLSSKSLCEVATMRGKPGESRTERFARADASRGVRMQQESRARSCENSPVGHSVGSMRGAIRRVMSSEGLERDIQPFQPVRPSW